MTFVENGWGQSPNGNGTTRRVAYLMSRFPKISETFILYEIVELERLGMKIEIFPLLREREPVMHPEAEALVERAHYRSLFSRVVLADQLHWLRERPRAYLRSWWEALRGNIRSPKFLSRALVVVPLAAHFARQMQALGIEHLHAHWATHPALAAYVIWRLTGLPYSFTAHAHDIYVERPMLEEKIRAATFVVTISEYNRRLLRELYGKLADKVEVIHCGADLELFQPPARRATDAPLTLVCVATLEERKGHQYLIEACARLKTEGVPFRCLFVGDGEERPRIEAEIERLGLGEEVNLLGRQPRDRVSALLAEADVVVLPSITMSNGKTEGIPVALMEALAMERAVVATALSGIPELIEDGHTGLLVPERDATALAEALLRLYRAPELREQLGQEGRRKVLQEFDLRRNAAALHQLLLRARQQEPTAPSPPALTRAVPQEEAVR